MAAPFKEIVFPEEIGFDAIGGRGWSTDVAVTRGKQRSVNENWPAPFGEWEVSLLNKTTAQMRQYEGFIHALHGSYYGFRFLDPRDFMIQNVAMQRLTSTTFQIRQRYPSGQGAPFDILVKKPKQNDPLRLVTLNTVPISEYTLDYTTGIVTMDATVPANVNPRYTGVYHVPVWLVTEKLAVRYVDQRFYSAENIHLQEMVL